MRYRWRVLTAEEFRSFARSATYQYARTYAKTAPHWYTLRKDHDRTTWDAAIMFIRRHGYERRWGGSLRTYYDCDGFKYWVGDGLGEVDISKEMVINREPLPGYDAEGL